MSPDEATVGSGLKDAYLTTDMPSRVEVKAMQSVILYCSFAAA